MRYLRQGKLYAAELQFKPENKTSYIDDLLVGKDLEAIAMSNDPSFFDDQAMGYVHVSRFDSHKTRRITMVSSKRIALFHDKKPTEKFKNSDKGPELATEYDSFPEYAVYGFGDITLPHIRIGGGRCALSVIIFWAV